MRQAFDNLEMKPILLGTSEQVPSAFPCIPLLVSAFPKEDQFKFKTVAYIKLLRKLIIIFHN